MTALELLQADASSRKWFGPDGGTFTLHGFIDDATGRITALYMSRNECLLGYLEAIRATILGYGLPMELYTDRAGIFNVNNKNAEFKDLHGNDIRKTQFGKMLDVLYWLRAKPRICSENVTLQMLILRISKKRHDQL